MEVVGYMRISAIATIVAFFVGKPAFRFLPTNSAARFFWASLKSLTVCLQHFECECSQPTASRQQLSIPRLSYNPEAVES